MNRQYNAFFYLLAFFSLPLQAQEGEQSRTAEQGASMAVVPRRSESGINQTESEGAFIDLLEFLGEFEAENGEWISPETLLGDEFNGFDEVPDSAFTNTTTNTIAVENDDND